MNSRKLALLILCSLLMTAGCQQPGVDDNPADQPMTEPEMSTTDPARLTLDQAVSAAREDFQKRHPVDPDAIQLVDARAVTWPDGSLGCPEDGMMYTQALVDGYYIRLSADDQVAHYHTGYDGRPMHCPAERSLKPPPRSDPVM